MPAPELWSRKRALSPARALKGLRAHKAHTSPEGRLLSYPASSLAPEDSWEADETSLLHQISSLTEPSRSYLAFRSVFFRMKVGKGGLSLFSLTKCILFWESIAELGNARGAAHVGR